jgi:hypothetical protein
VSWFRRKAGLRLRTVLAEIKRGELTSARIVFTDAACESWRERVECAIRAHLDLEEPVFGFIGSVMRDLSLPEPLRSHASMRQWLRDQGPAGPDHREFLRQYGKKSIDDFED